MTKNFIHDDFMLTNKTASALYHRFAADQPIIDYHNHLSPSDIATNRRFDDLFDMWVDHDHYKWRAMRVNGIDESLVTGDGDQKEKFLAFAATVPHSLRNPLYHWTHLELKRYFGIDDLLSPETAESVWENAGEQIRSREDLQVRGILKQFKVTALCTTDDPTDDLKHHLQIAGDDSIDIGVYPAFRPDWAMFVHRVSEFNPWVEKLETVSGVTVNSLESFLEALRQRHDFFHQCGARLSDHGMEYVPDDFCDHSTAEAIDAQRTRPVLDVHVAVPCETGCGKRLDQSVSHWRLAE